LSQALVSQVNQTISNNNAALQSLFAQHQALLSAQQTLQSELDSLAQLSSVLDSNELALRQGISQIDTSIASASSRRQPEIDEVLVCPTIVGQQVYSVVAEEQAARDVRLALGRALDKGRVGVKEYVKEMRGVGREEFLRKAVVRKAGMGMGLDIGDGTWR
jgi:ESCRT-I complex subunit TSG101